MQFTIPPTTLTALEQIAERTKLPIHILAEHAIAIGCRAILDANCDILAASRTRSEVVSLAQAVAHQHENPGAIPENVVSFPLQPEN